MLEPINRNLTCGTPTSWDPLWMLDDIASNPLVMKPALLSDLDTKMGVGSDHSWPQ
jgi:hypothetical protein